VWDDVKYCSNRHAKMSRYRTSWKLCIASFRAVFKGFIYTCPLAIHKEFIYKWFKIHYGLNRNLCLPENFPGSEDEERRPMQNFLQ
jgi:hypothetical protein